MAGEIEQIDLSEFGLSGDGASPADPPATLPSGEISADVMAELGMDGGHTVGLSESKNGQEASVQASLPFDTFDAPERPQPQRQRQPTPELPKAALQSTPPSTGFGILEQILLELTACNLEMRALRQQLQGSQATGPSVLASPESTQAGSQPTSTAPTSGSASPTADAPARPRRGRGRPAATATPEKKEDDEFGL